MNRRGFIGAAVTAGLGLIAKRAAAKDGNTKGASAAPEAAEDHVDPYFLESGDISPEEQQSILAFEDYQERLMDGRPAIMPRGGKPKRAPTFRFLRWQGRLGDPEGRFVGPLTLSPEFDPRGPFDVNAQILGFHVSTRDWTGARGHGTISIEFRARRLGEPMTWLYLEQFEARKGGGNSVGLEYVAQRDGAPEPVICEEPNLDIRIQLIRHRKAPGVLRKVLQVGSFLSGLPLGGGGGGSPMSLASSQPAIRVPQMVREGVAFAQATVGGMSDDAPVWRGGFTSYALAKGGSRLALSPGFWVAVDDSPDIDYRSLRLEDIGGRIGVLRDGEALDLNHLVLAMEIAQGKG